MYSTPEVGTSPAAAATALITAWSGPEQLLKPFTGAIGKALRIAEQLIEIFENDLGIAVITSYLQPVSFSDFNCFVIVDAVTYLSSRVTAAGAILERAEAENEDDVFTLITTFQPYALNNRDDLLCEGAYFERLPTE